jgi:uncharacterized protein (TIGR03382 family)
MMAYRSSILAIAIIASACSVDTTSAASSAIIGGDTSAPNEFPATGMLVVGRQMLCTATLIAHDVILTAAHCLADPLFGDFGFTLDTDASDGIDNIIPVRFTHQHPDFDDGVENFLGLAVRNDIGIGILESEILDVPAAPVDTPLFQTAIDTGNQLAMCGYGRIAWYEGEKPIKRDAMVLVDQTQSYEFSTAPMDPQPCIGDSGAPLFIDSPDGPRIVGLVSRALGPSEMCDTGAIITRVGPYSQWIDEASRDRDSGCSAAGGSSLLPLGALAVILARRRRSLAREDRAKPGVSGSCPMLRK